MYYKRVLSVQDISCFGQCSTTVALPVLSACGVECAILPSAILSTHTSGFFGYTVRDLAGDFPAIFNHWKTEGISFDAIYTGYLGSANQVDYILDFYNSFEKKPILIVDPAMGDNGLLYPSFDMNYVKAMRKLCASADIILPNRTEQVFLFGEGKKELSLKKNAHLVVTGVSRRNGYTGVEVFGPDGNFYYEHEKLPDDSHGTGDVFSSAFVGAIMKGRSVRDAVKIAADFTLICIRDAQGRKDHSYGVRFELFLHKLICSLG